MVFEIENTKMRNVGFMNALFLLGRVLESLKVELFISYFELTMVKKYMEKVYKRWKAFPMLYFPKLFLREQMDSQRVFGHHRNAMNFFLLCIQWPYIYRTIKSYLISCSKCEWEGF